MPRKDETAEAPLGSAGRLPLFLAAGAFALVAAGAISMKESPYLGLACLVLAVVALALLPGVEAAGELHPLRPRRQAWEPVFVALLLVLAVAFRFHDLQNSPPGAHGHEGEMAGYIAGYLGKGPYEPHVRDSNILWPSLVFYQGEASAKVFGWTAKAFRYPSAVWGVLAVLAFYFTARCFCAPWVAAVAALFFNAHQLGLVMGRNFFPGSILYTAVLGGLGFCLAGLRERKLWMLFVGGFLAGLSMHGYVPGRPVGIVFLAWFAWLWLTKRPLAPDWKLATAFGAGFIACAGVVIWWALTHWAHYMHYVDTMNPNRAKGVVAYAATFIKELPPYLKMFFHSGDLSSAEEIPFTPFFTPLASAWVVVGLGVALAGFWRGLPSVLLAFFMLGLSASVLGQGFSHPTYRRLVLLVPPAFLLAAYAFERVRLGIAASKKSWVNAALVALAFLAAFWATWRSWDHYFTRYSHDPRVVAGRHYGGHLVGNLMRANPKAIALVGPHFTGVVAAAILLPENQGNLVFRGLEDLLQVPPGRDAVLALEPWWKEQVGQLKELLPGIELTEYPGPVVEGSLYPGSMIGGVAKAAQLQALRGFLLKGTDKVFDLRSTALPSDLAGREVEFEATAFLPGKGGGVTGEAGAPDWSLSLDGKRLDPVRATVFSGGVHRLSLKGRVPAQGLGPLPMRLMVEGQDLFNPLRVMAHRFANGIRMEFRRIETPDTAKPDAERLEVHPQVFQYDITILPLDYKARLKAWFTPPTTGEWRFETRSSIRSRIRVAGKPVFDSMDPGMPKLARSIKLTAGQAVPLEADFYICAVFECRLPVVLAAPPGGEFKVIDAAWVTPR